MTTTDTPVIPALDRAPATVQLARVRQGEVIVYVYSDGTVRAVDMHAVPVVEGSRLVDVTDLPFVPLMHANFLADQAAAYVWAERHHPAIRQRVREAAASAIHRHDCRPNLPHLPADLPPTLTREDAADYMAVPAEYVEHLSPIHACLRWFDSGRAKHRVIGWRAPYEASPFALGVIAAESPDWLVRTAEGPCVTGAGSTRLLVDRAQAARLFRAGPGDLSESRALDAADRVWLLDRR